MDSTQDVTVSEEVVQVVVATPEFEEIDLDAIETDVETTGNTDVEETVVELVAEMVSEEIGEEVVQPEAPQMTEEVASPLDPNAVLYVPDEFKSPFVFDTRVFMRTPEGVVLLYDAAGVVPVYYCFPGDFENWYPIDLKRFSLSRKVIEEIQKSSEEDMKFVVLSCANFMVTGMKVATPEEVYKATVELEKNDRYKKTNFTLVSHSLCKKLLFEADSLECKNVQDVSMVVATTLVDVSLGGVARSPVYESICHELKNQLRTLRQNVDYSEYQRCLYTMAQGMLGVAIRLMTLMGEERVTEKVECEHQLYMNGDEQTTSDVKSVTTYKAVINKIKARNSKQKEWEERRRQREERAELSHFTRVPEFSYDVEIITPVEQDQPTQSKSGGKKKHKGRNKVKPVV